MAEVDGHRTLKPFEGRIIVAHLRILLEIRQDESFLVSRKLRRYGLENGGNLVPQGTGELGDVGTVQRQDVTLDSLHLMQIMGSLKYLLTAYAV